MANMTPIFGLYSPDEGETVEPDIYTAMMMQSVEGSLGTRMLKQEKQVGIRATIGGTFSVSAYQTVPLTIDKAFGYSANNYLTGLTLNGGIVTITTGGLYSLSAILTMSFADKVPFDFSYKVGSAFNQVVAVETSTTSWTSGSLTDTMYLQAGDTVQLWVGVGAGRTDTLTCQATYFSLTMLYAT